MPPKKQPEKGKAGGNAKSGGGKSGGDAKGWNPLLIVFIFDIFTIYMHFSVECK